ncbi:unannotated protein [freshwater metagenome]|uniref:Unannotated protein n=1 Tax=freshwater metagenome TaxID=449393 RepID=A0A6J7ESW4_9ZZZZ
MKVVALVPEDGDNEAVPNADATCPPAPTPAPTVPAPVAPTPTRTTAIVATIRLIVLRIRRPL